MNSASWIYGSFTLAALTLAPTMALAAVSPVVGEIQTHRTDSEDTLLDIAHQYDIGYVAMIAANPVVDPWVPGEGRDLTILSYAAMAHTSLEAAERLAKEGIDAEVIDLRTLLPLDRETILASVKKTNKLLVVHEDTRTGGIAGEIAALVCEEAFEDLDGPILRVTALDTPVPYAPTLEERFLPDAEKVFAAARELAGY